MIFIEIYAKLLTKIKVFSHNLFAGKTREGLNKINQRDETDEKIVLEPMSPLQIIGCLLTKETQETQETQETREPRWYSSETPGCLPSS
jgi:hypothetical protein